MAPTTNYLTKAQMRVYKTRLTRAIRSGNHQRVINTVTDTFEEWDHFDYVYPDDWHRWERAREDARTALRLAS